MAANDAARVERASHALKGAAGTVGASALAGLAAQINQQAKNDALSEARALAESLVEASETTLEEFDEIIRSQK